MRTVLFGLVIICSQFNLAGQSRYEAPLFDAYFKSDMQAWKSVIDRMQKDPLARVDTIFTEELLSYQYGYVAWYLGYGDEDEAEKYLEIAEVNLDWLEKKGYNQSQTRAYRAAFYGFWIGVSTWYFTIYSTRVISNAEEAVNSNPLNAFAYLQWGNIRYYQPSFVGGSVVEAIDYYKKAQSLMEIQQNKELSKDWIYLNLLVTIAEANEKFGRYEEAKYYYLKVLKLLPNYEYVKGIKYPALLQKMKDSD